MVTIRIGEDEETLSWEQWEQRVRSGRVPGYALVRFEPVTGADFVEADSLDLFHSLRDDARQAWSDRYRAGPPPWMTALLAGVMIRVWWLTATGDLRGWVAAMNLFQPDILEAGEVWRLLSMGLLHSGVGHITSNLVMFVYVGWNLERALGRLNLLTLFVASVLGGSVLSALLTPETPSLGASGGVLGVVAAATVFGFVRHNLLSDRTRVIFGWALLPYLLLIFGMGWTNETTDNWAHTGGLVTGALLALVLDPPGLERRRGWNVASLSVCWSGMAAILLGVWAFGPRLLHLEDVAERGRTPLVRPPHREVVHAAPAAWRRTTLGGQPTYVSRGSRDRRWSVQLATRDPRHAPERLVAAWLDELRDDHLSVEVLREPHPVSFAGRDGTHAAVLLDEAEGRRQVERWVAVRGTQVLVATWSVEARLAGRMAGVRDGLVASVSWNQPDSLLRAREAARRSPRNRAVQRRLATELLRVGQIDQGFDLLRELVDDEPRLPDGWTALIEAARQHPDALPDAEDLVSTALATEGDPSIAAEAALLLEARDRGATARGLLELAWTAFPGDRAVRRSRRTLGMPTDLVDGVPAHLLHDPLTGAPMTDPRRLPDPGPWTLAQAREVGASLAAERDVLLERHAAAEGVAALPPLVVLALGRLPEPEALPDALGGILADLRTAREGRTTPRWMPDALVARVEALPEGALAELEAELVALLPPDTPSALSPGTLDALGLVRTDDALSLAVDG